MTGAGEHGHAGSTLSGVYYVRSPGASEVNSGGGLLHVYDPRHAALEAMVEGGDATAARARCTVLHTPPPHASSQTLLSNPSAHNRCTFEPRPGLLLIWPSYLVRHAMSTRMCMACAWHAQGFLLLWPPYPVRLAGVAFIGQPLSQHTPPLCGQRHEVSPTEARMCMACAWQRHEVSPTEGESARISIPFDLNLGKDRSVPVVGQLETHGAVHGAVAAMSQAWAHQAPLSINARWNSL